MATYDETLNIVETVLRQHGVAAPAVPVGPRILAARIAEALTGGPDPAPDAGDLRATADRLAEKAREARALADDCRAHSGPRTAAVYEQLAEKAEAAAYRAALAATDTARG